MKKEIPVLKFSICMPVYNGAKVLAPTIRSILSQSFTNFELIIVDDVSNDNTVEVAKSFKDPRIKIFRNQKNLGYPGNIECCRKKAKGDVLYLMGQDDILGKGALMDTYQAFLISDDIGAVTRPYYWFDQDIGTPVRAKDQLNPNTDEVVTINDDWGKIHEMFKTLDQLSGLAYRRKYINRPFQEDIFPSHVYPFASIFKKHPAVFLRDYNVAVRIASSQSRTLSSVYDKSPVQSWVELFETVFFEPKFTKFRNYMIKNFVAKNYVGLVQIRNYARYRYFWREVGMLLRYRPANLVNPAFWFFSLGCMIMPPIFLIPLVDWYKGEVNARKLRNIKFEYELANV